MIARALAVCMMVLGATAGAHAAEVVPQLSADRIEITSNFKGAELILFGAIRDGPAPFLEQDFLDIVVVLRGPPSTVTVRRKERRAGILVNGAGLTFEHVPGFYFVASRRPLDITAPPEVLKAFEIGTQNLNVSPQPGASEADPATVAELRQAIIERKRRQGLYQDNPGAIKVREETLFRTRIEVPSSVPVGEFKARVFLLRDGRVLHNDEVQLQVDKIGIERLLFNFAHNWGFVYGLTAVLFAIFAGWIASVIFRR
ncbi:MAG: TIGR02186 family protein [Pseudomonadota bacterium]